MTEQLDVKTDIALIKKDISQIEKTLSKLDSTLDTIASISKTLALQERVVSQHEKRLDDLDAKITKHHRDELEFRAELQEQIRQLSESNRVHIEEFKSMSVIERETKHREVMEMMDAIRKELRDTNDAQNHKISALENWKWWVMGASVAFVTVGSFVWKTIWTAVFGI